MRARKESMIPLNESWWERHCKKICIIGLVAFWVFIAFYTVSGLFYWHGVGEDEPVVYNLVELDEERNQSKALAGLYMGCRADISNYLGKAGG